jgi:hypothetical protein
MHNAATSQCMQIDFFLYIKKLIFIDMLIQYTVELECSSINYEAMVVHTCNWIFYSSICWYANSIL